MKITVFHNVATDTAGRPLGMMDGYTAGHPLVPVLEYEQWGLELGSGDDGLHLGILRAVYKLLNVGDDPDFTDGKPSPLAVSYRARRNRSLSVGDVVRIDDAWHACASHGWTQIEAPQWFAYGVTRSGTTSLDSGSADEVTVTMRASHWREITLSLRLYADKLRPGTPQQTNARRRADAIEATVEANG